MKAIRAITSKQVYFLFPDDAELELGQNLTGPGLLVLDINSETHEIVDAPMPEFFAGGGVMIYDNEWSIFAQHAYDEAKAKADAEQQAAAIAANSARAKQALLDTDWCENASVRNTAVTPHLTNGEAFDAYRLQMRAIIVNKVASVEAWPDQPTGIWA